MLDYQAILEEIHTALKKVENTGEVANYIPELAAILTPFRFSGIQDFTT